MFFYHTGVKQTIKSGVLVLVASLLLISCTARTTKAPVEDGTAPVTSTTSTDSIDDMLAGFEPAAAIAFLDDAAANSNPDRAFELLVRAAEIAIEHEPGQSTDQRIVDLHQQYPDQSYAVRLTILKNRALLASKKTAQVIESLDRLLSLATPREKLLIQALKAEALLQAGFPIESVQMRIALDADYQRLAPEKQADNDSQLWNSLMQAHPDIISSHISEIPDTFSGWLELANIAQRYRYDSAALNTGIDSWIARNPDHAANRHIIEFIKQKQIATSSHPEHIALILPLSGKLAAVGSAVRDGFMSAYFESSRIFGTQITIDVYDSEGNAERAAQAVQTANNRGTKFIVGPLDKQAVAAAIAANQSLEAAIETAPAGAPDKQPALPAIVPNHADMLILNQVSSNLLIDSLAESPDDQGLTTEPVIYQLDLAPENEAVQVAERASLEGLGYAMVMVPENIWGNRMYEAFTNRYQSLGGEVVAQVRFKKGSSDFSSGIQQGLKLNLSKIRHKQIESTLYKDIGFTPRRRQDIDMIFIATSPHEARLIKPQLKFFYSDDIPVYATSSVYSGSVNARRDKDLENIKFCDMPWLLTDRPALGSLQNTITNAWPQESAKFLRFHALGADAFLLLPQLKWLKDNNNNWISGGTGRLFLNPAGVVQRKLSWATFKHSVPRLDREFSN